jgi:hypothetical protein
MYSLTQLKQALFLIVLMVFGLLPVQAVVPPPDGCYPNLTTAEGCNALFSLAIGQGNTAIGHDALFSDTSGSWNTGIGAVALGFNNGDFNTAVGVAGMLLNDTGGNNTAVGAAALLFNNSGEANTATGAFALYNNTSGNSNTAMGTDALLNNVEGSGNTANGWGALSHNNGTPPDGSANTAVGAGALFSNTTGDSNTAIGENALVNNTIGSGNTAVGVRALDHNTSGDLNIALGVNAGHDVVTAQNAICIGLNVFGADVGDSCFIGNIFGQTSASGAAVYVNSNHRLGTLTSSSRFKNDIKPMERVSEALFALKPVTFHYKKEIDPAGMQQFGLVAEDVEKINPDLVVRDNEGKPYSVRYEQVNAMMLNEFLKEHRKNEEQQAVIAQLKTTDAKQEATITKQQKQIEALTAELQKVSAQIELTKSGPQTVLNNR